MRRECAIPLRSLIAAMHESLRGRYRSKFGIVKFRLAEQSPRTLETSDPADTEGRSVQRCLAGLARKVTVRAMVKCMKEERWMGTWWMAWSWRVQAWRRSSG